MGILFKVIMLTEKIGGASAFGVSRVFRCSLQSLSKHSITVLLTLLALLTVVPTSAFCTIQESAESVQDSAEANADFSVVVAAIDAASSDWANSIDVSCDFEFRQGMSLTFEAAERQSFWDPIHGNSATGDIAVGRFVKSGELVRWDFFPVTGVNFDKDSKSSSFCPASSILYGGMWLSHSPAVPIHSIGCKTVLTPIAPSADNLFFTSLYSNCSPFWKLGGNESSHFAKIFGASGAGWQLKRNAERIVFTKSLPGDSAAIRYTFQWLDDRPLLISTESDVSKTMILNWQAVGEEVFPTLVTEVLGPLSVDGGRKMWLSRSWTAKNLKIGCSETDYRLEYDSEQCTNVDFVYTAGGIDIRQVQFESSPAKDLRGLEHESKQQVAESDVEAETKFLSRFGLAMISTIFVLISLLFYFVFMKSSTSISLLLIMSLTLSWGCQRPPENPSEKSVALVSEGQRDQSFDLGKVLVDAETCRSVSHQFVYTNDFDVDISLSLMRTSCGCTSVQIEREKLKPGESTRIIVSISASYVREALTETAFFLSKFSDGRAERFQLQVSASTIPKIEIVDLVNNRLRIGKGESLYFNVLCSSADKQERTLELELDHSENLHVNSTVTGFRTISDNVCSKLFIVEVNAAEIDMGDGWLTLGLPEETNANRRLEFQMRDTLLLRPRTLFISSHERDSSKTVKLVNAMGRKFTFQYNRANLSVVEVRPDELEIGTLPGVEFPFSEKITVMEGESRVAEVSVSGI